MATIIIALDRPTAVDALAVVDRIADAVDFYKIGSQLFTRAGPQIVHELNARGKRVLLDLKYHDIPSTVARAVEAAAAIGVDMLTLHASGGLAMLREARAAVAGAGPRLIGVTLLTSATADDIQEVWGKEPRSLREEVARLAALAADAELDGVVASALEAEVLKRRHGSDFLVLTPGIRPAGARAGDQVRTATPAHAVEAGSDFLIIGRPVLGAPDPVAAVEEIRREMAVAEKPA